MLLNNKRNMKEKKHKNSIEYFVNNAHKIFKGHQKNKYPKDIKNLFERLGIE